MSKHRIAILISLMLAMPAAVVAIEQAAPDSPQEAAEPPAAVAATAEPAAPAAEPMAQSATEIGTPVTSVSGLSGLVRATPSSTFPIGDSDTEWHMLPAKVAYFERIEQERSHLVARGDSFPMGTLGESHYEPLPAMVAYFDRLERQQIAGAQPETQEEAAAVSTVSPIAELRNNMKSAANYMTGLFKSGKSSTPAENTASADAAQ